jgi:hypothetical protein
MDEKVETSAQGQQATADIPPAAQPPVVPPADPPPIQPRSDGKGEDSRKKMSTSELVMMWATIVIAAGTIVSAGAIFLQWREMANGSSDTTAIKLAAQKQADAAEQFADTAGFINGNIGDAVKKLDAQAKATQDASRNAKDALHVSERAYLVFGDIQFDLANKLITVQVINTGHIPSGHADIVIHEATFNTTSPADTPQVNQADEKSWRRTPYEQISPTIPARLGVPIPLADIERVKVGKQIILISGFVTYYDGFSGTAQQRQPYCIQTIYHIVAKENLPVICDATYFLPKMEAADGYPNNESPH